MSSSSNNNTNNTNNNTLVAGQLSEDSFLYVWTPTHVSRLNRRNKITSPQLQLPNDVVSIILENNNEKNTNNQEERTQQQQTAASLIESCKIVLLRGVVKAEKENDDPIGVFLQIGFKKNENENEKETTSNNNHQKFRCKMTVTCTPVRPGGHSHTAGPEEFTFTPSENFKGMRTILPAVALKPKEAESLSQEEAESSSPSSSSSPASKENQDEIRFQETSPVEIHLKIQFLKTKIAAAAGSQNSNNNTKEKATELLNQASTLFSGFTSQASTTLGSWWSTAATTSKEKVLPSMKNAFSSATEKVETFAHKLMKDDAKREEVSEDNNNNNISHQQEQQNHTTSTTSSSTNGDDAAAVASSSSSSIVPPWQEIPVIPTTHSENMFFKENIRKWQELITEKIVDEQDSNFLWAPENVDHRNQVNQKKKRQQQGIDEKAFRYPFFTFSPEEELALSQLGLSANQLLHCLDDYNFDVDVDQNFVNAKDPHTQHLRRMRLNLVPQSVNESMFWGAYLWRVKCLSFCKNEEQLAIVKTLISKPVQQERVHHHQSEKNHSRSSSSSNSHQHHNNNGNDEDDTSSGNDLTFHKQLVEEATEALSLLEEVVSGDEKEESSSALFVASLRGAERSQNVLNETMKGLDEMLVAKLQAVPSLRESWKSQWRELGDLKKKLEELIERAKQNPAPSPKKKEEEEEEEEENKNRNDDDDDANDQELEKQIAEKQQEKKKEEEIAKLSAIEEVSSPQPAKPDDEQVEETKEKQTATTSSSSSPVAASATSKSRTPVLMPWEEEDED